MSYVRDFKSFLNEGIYQENFLKHHYEKYGFSYDRTSSTMVYNGSLDLTIHGTDKAEGFEETTLVFTLDDDSVILEGDDKIAAALKDGLIAALNKGGIEADKFLAKHGFKDA